MSASRGLSRAAVPLLFLASLTAFALSVASVASPGVRPVALAMPAEPLPAAPRVTVSAYTIDAALDPERHVILASGTIDFTNVSTAPLDHLFVHLYLEAFASDRTVFHRARTAAFRGAARRGEGRTVVSHFAVPAWGGENLWPEGARTPGDPEDGTDIRVPLPRALPPGETLRIALAWESRLPPLSLRTGHAGSFHMAAQWFPKIAKLEPDGTFAHFPFERLSEFYADFSDWDVTVKVPPTFLVGATGAEVAAREEGGLVAHRFVQRGVHDFAFAAWDGFREQRGAHRGVRLRCLYPEGYEAVARLELDVVRHGLDSLGASYGAYPFDDLTIIHPPAEASDAGGMEYPTLITTGGPWWGPLLGVRTAELVTIHELAHQWFQGIIASNEREHPFLDEGLTMFAETDGLRSLVPEDATLSMALGLPLATLGFHRAHAVEPARRGSVARAARDFEDGHDYGALVYRRAAILLETLDRVHGGGMRRALGVYAREQRFGHPTPADLLRVVGAELGGDAEEVLRLGLFERGSIDVSIRGVSSRPAPSGGWDVFVELAREGSIALPVEAELVDEEGRVHRLSWDGLGPSTTIEARTASPPRFVVLDPERKLLLDDDLLDGAWASRPAPVVAARTLGATSAILRAALAIAGP